MVRDGSKWGHQTLFKEIGANLVTVLACLSSSLGERCLVWVDRNEALYARVESLTAFSSRCCMFHWLLSPVALSLLWGYQRIIPATRTLISDSIHSILSLIIHLTLHFYLFIHGLLLHDAWATMTTMQTEWFIAASNGTVNSLSLASYSCRYLCSPQLWSRPAGWISLMM